MASTPKPKWRSLAPEMNQMSAEKAAVLFLHHLELAASMFGCIEADLPHKDIDVDDLDRSLKQNEISHQFAMAALEKRYPPSSSNDHIRAGAAAFIKALTDHRNASDRDWHDQLHNLPVVEVDDDGRVIETRNN